MGKRTMQDKMLNRSLQARIKIYEYPHAKLALYLVFKTAHWERENLGTSLR